MRLVLFRHGIAEDRRVGLDDAGRALTARGVQRTAEAAAGLARLVCQPHVVLTSPKLRARQTANLVAETFDVPVEAMSELAHGTPAAIRTALTPRTDPSVILVGHEPVMSRLAMLLMGAESVPGGIELKKAGAVMLEGDLDRAMVLRWAVPPRALRMLGGG